MEDVREPWEDKNKDKASGRIVPEEEGKNHGSF
jgi:hypothetical protein